MAGLLFDPPVVRTIPVEGDSRTYPVSRIFCVGRNYAAHAAEMGADVDREAPFYFTKSLSAVHRNDSTIAYPPGTGNFHYEMELALAIAEPAFRVPVEAALSKVFGYCCALDMTRRDLQQAARQKQRPWDLGKDVEQSAIFAPLARATDFGEIGRQAIRLQVNGETRQDASLSDMIWSVPEIVADLSNFYHLAPGDMIMTGTPAGVGPVVPGDRIEGHIDGLAPVRLAISDAENT